VRFSTPSECANFVRPLGLSAGELLAGKPPARMKKTCGFFTTAPRIDPRAADVIVDCLGAFEEALLWTYDLVFGDQSDDPKATQSWREYGRWRKSMGARSSISDEPGCVFARSERDDLQRSVLWTMKLGHGSLLVPHPARCVLRFSHEDDVILHARTNDPGFRRLGDFGFRPMTRF